MRMGAVYLLLTLVSTAVAKQCYDCGYQVNDWTPDNKGEQIPLEGIPVCGDDTELESHVTECESGDECCGMIREYFVKEPSDGLPRYIDMVARHACEKTLTDMFDSGPNVTCNMGFYKCYNISFDNLPEHEATYAEACYCEGDKCNNKIPDLPDPQPSTQKPSSLPPGTFHKCYNCGYRCNNMKGTACIPEPIDNDGKVPFCGDIAIMETTTKQCGGGDECCGSVKEYFIQ